MDILIISDDLKQGLFLKRGLQFENLNASVVPVSETDNLLGEYTHFRSVILALGNLSQISSLYDGFKRMNPNIHFVILNSVFNRPIMEYATQKSIQVYFSPFPLRIISNEIKQNFIEYDLGNECSYTIRDLELNVNAHRVKVRDKEIYLRNKEFNLLYYLMMNKGKILSRNMIIENVWDRNADIITNTVEVHISNLRKKIDKNSLSKYIYTIPCTGYMLN